MLLGLLFRLLQLPVETLDQLVLLDLHHLLAHSHVGLRLPGDRLMDQFGQSLLRAVLRSLLVQLEELDNCDILDAQLQVVQLGEEADHILVLQLLKLELLHLLCDHDVVHFVSLVLLVVRLLFLERGHEVVLILV